MNLRSSLVVACALAMAGPVARAAVYQAADAQEVAALKLAPADEVVLKDGNWADQEIVVSASGTAENPITIRAQTPGKVVLTGRSQVVLGGDYLVCSGVYLKGVARDGDAIALRGSHCRLTESAVAGGGTKFFVHLIGIEEQVDHCYLAEKTSEDPTLQVEVQRNRPNNDRIEFNHFGHRPPLGKNGGETMRVGYSGQSQWNSRTIVEHNLFTQCDGEIEIISSKSCENVYRYNTFRECAGFLTLRHGHRCLVDSNFFFGGHVKGSGGVRVINEGQKVTNNYIEGVDKGAFWITAGIKDSPLAGYVRAKNCLIAFNTVVDYAGPGVELASGFGSSNRTLAPEDVTIADNIFAPGKRGILVQEGPGKYDWAGNVAALDMSGGSTAEKVDPKQFTAAKVKLVRGEDGLYRPAEPVPAVGEYPAVKADVDGQPREGQLEAGCDQRSSAPVTNRPLTPKDVGPSWMERQ